MDAPIKKAGYENIYVDCPCCNKENIYNRINDLGTTEAIARKNNMVCQFCGAVFSILSDTVKRAKYRWFLDEIHILKERKNYMLYILYLCQACEAFFEQAIFNIKLDRDKKIKDSAGYININSYNIERKKLCNTTIFDLCGKGSKKITLAKATFTNLRIIFLQFFSYSTDQNVTDALEIISKTKIHELRNRIIHKNAYRPNINEVEGFDSLIDALFLLGNKLDIMDSLYVLNEN